MIKHDNSGGGMAIIEKENGGEHIRRELAAYEKNGRMKYMKPEMLCIVKNVGKGMPPPPPEYDEP